MLLDKHMADLARFVSIAKQTGAQVAIVPLDHSVPRDEKLHGAWEAAAKAADVPVWSLKGVYDGREMSELVVNSLDSHPNELAHRLASVRVVAGVLHRR